MASLAELERDIIIERTNSGLKAARVRGKKRGGRPSKGKLSIDLALKCMTAKSILFVKFLMPLN